ncbi:hypothetical protein ACJ8BP_01905 [Klebsiella pneumoniae]
MNDAGVRPFSIRALLEDRARYLVPMYQRNYAWGEGGDRAAAAGCAGLSAKID